MSRVALLRARYLLVRHGNILAIALLLLGAVALAGAGWAQMHPSTTEVTDETHRQTIQSTLSTQAVVVEDSRLYTSGQTLRDQPVYLRSATPSPNLLLQTAVPDGERVTVNQRIELTYRAAREGETFWENTTTLVQTETTTSSGTVKIRTPLDINATQSRANAIRETIEGAGSVHVELRLYVSYETPRYNGTMSKPIALQITNDWYRLGSPTATREHSTPVTRTVKIPGQEMRAAGPALLGVLSLGLGLVVGKFSRDESRGLEPSTMEEELHRMRYTDWISTGTIPDREGMTVIEVESLEALVDVAIDTNTRTIYDPDRDCYAIFDGSTTYWYEAS